MVWHVTSAPACSCPPSAPAQITPFGMLYAIHDALVRPYPGQKMGPSLAESWEESEDGKTYEFRLRQGLTFHNGDPVTTQEVRCSCERYKGTGAKPLKEHVKEVEIVDPRVVRFHLKEPWPDFMTFYGTTATAAGIVVPKKYMTEVGDDGFKKHPIGAGPYKFVSTQPGVEVVLEAFTGYWRRVPNVKTLVMRSVPEATTRALMLQTGEADIDAGDFTPNPGFPTVADAIMNDLNKAGIRVQMRQMERATFYGNWIEKKLHGVVMIGAGNSGNAASRVESFIYSKGAYAFGGYPDLDELFLKQAGERDPKKREAMLFQIQQATIDRAMFAPVMDLRALMGIGPRVTKHTVTDVWMSPFPSYEDMEIKG